MPEVTIDILYFMTLLSCLFRGVLNMLFLSLFATNHNLIQT